MGIAAAAKKRAQEHVVVWRAMRPFGRHPRRREKWASLDTRYDEPAALHRMIDLIAAIAEGHGRRRGVRDLFAQRRQPGVNAAQDSSDGICGNGKDDRLCANLSRGG